MRRIALLGSLLLLAGCSGFGSFLGDTLSPNLNPNRPRIDSDNMRRAMGQSVDTTPLLPESGNVWPGPPKPEPTLEDIEREQNDPNAPSTTQPPARGSSTPPGSVQPVAPIGQIPPPTTANPTPAAPPRPQPGSVPTPGGQAVITRGANGVGQYLAPNGSTGTVVKNGDGTLTTIAPDGSTSTVPAPR